MTGNPESHLGILPPEASVSREDVLNPQRVVDLVVGSYAFSQGSQAVQGRVFDYYHYLNPDYSIPFDLFVQTIEPLQSRIAKIVGGKGHRDIATDQVKSDSVERLRDLQSSLDGPEITEEEGNRLIFQLTRDVILSDFGFLCLHKGRPKEKMLGEPYSPFTDKYLSYTYYFALDRDEEGNNLHTQNVPELTELYQRIGSVITSGADLGAVSLDKIANYYARGWDEYGAVIMSILRNLRSVGIHAVNDGVDMRRILSEVQKVHESRPLS